MSGPPLPRIPQDGHTMPYQPPHSVDANGVPLQQYQFQTGALHSHYNQQQSGNHYANIQWTSPHAPYPQSNAPSNTYQQLSQTTPTSAHPRYAAPPQLQTPQQVYQTQQPMQSYPAYGFQGQAPQSNWQVTPHPQQQIYRGGGVPQMNNTPRNFRHQVPQQFFGAPNHTMAPGSNNVLTGERIEGQGQYGGLSAKAAGKRKAVDYDDASSLGESSSGPVKRARPNAGSRQVYMPPPPVPQPGFSATGRMRAPPAVTGPSNGQSIVMTGMQFNQGVQSEASGVQANQYMTFPQNGGGNTPSAQNPEHYYNQNRASTHVRHAPNGANGSSQTMYRYSQDPSAVGQYNNRGQYNLAFKNNVMASIASLFRNSVVVTFLRGQSLLKFTERIRGNFPPVCRWFLTSEREVYLLWNMHTQRPAAFLSPTAALVARLQSSSLTEITSNDEKKRTEERVVMALNEVLDRQKRIAASKHFMGRTSYAQNGPNRSVGNLPGPSEHSLPTPARTPVQLNAATQAPPPAPAIAVEVMRPTDSLPADEAWFTLPALPESPRTPDEAQPAAPAPTVEETYSTGTVSFDDFWSTLPPLRESPRIRDEAPPPAPVLTVEETYPTDTVPFDDFWSVLPQLPESPRSRDEAPPPGPVIGVEETRPTDSLSTDEAWSTLPSLPESPRTRDGEPGEELELPPLHPSPVDQPATLDEKPTDTAEDQAKTEEEQSGGTSEGPQAAVIMDMPWFTEFFPSLSEGQAGTSTSKTSGGDQSKTDGDGRAEDLEYERVFKEFMVNDEDEDENGNGNEKEDREQDQDDGLTSLFGSPLLSTKDGSLSLPK
ncbi:uncharacterized protein EV420DRAFT_1100435 [Desarmillaria tabescens]|uniref:Uncharacterized protein n=1 Tax=Armillaria tabescens TaxID=1929756 RepID=A0AA39NDJ7_ARMTA|nr:uncharacterized protein EV420DRAFT_1100435 [Desarmillaria tabescens]KAK0463644.1 hypothetical protein EV420DRAFT_1100435 [Desarmillaria tabescens]